MEVDWRTLVERVRLRHEAAERELVERLYPRVAGTIRTWKARRETVDDLAQEVFLRVFSRLDQFRGGSFPAWVDSITRRVCFDALRKRRIRPEWTFAELGDDAPGETAAELHAGDVDAGEVIAALLARLPPEQAWLLREVELAERSIGDVSKEMGWTAARGRLRLFRARHALRRIYDAWTQDEETAG